jgi:hypothetical protein
VRWRSWPYPRAPASRSRGSRDGRTELATALDFIRPGGDTLVVVKLDQLGRSTRDVLNLVHELESKGAHLRVLEPEVSTKGPVGKMVLTVLGMVAEMEVGFIRTASGGNDVLGERARHLFVADVPFGDLLTDFVSMFLGWRIGGQTRRIPFSSARRAPLFPVTTLSNQEREALRPMCGPIPQYTRNASQAQPTAKTAVSLDRQSRWPDPLMP